MSAFDENEASLLASAMTPDVALTINGNDESGFEHVQAHSLNTVGPMDTIHFVTNIRIDVADNDAAIATLTANTLAQHYLRGNRLRSSERRLLGGSKHVMELSEDEKNGLWKVNLWHFKTVWREGGTRSLHPKAELLSLLRK
ncbi:hypothetical protein GCG54_00013214 [Colletotrichum gloeosporioides]|uniref:SnoaL-like domain-containing protein n=1 Tax=Colletotrichum gloeosporioides TaxID=474922 RepID=A0A8H4C7B5_COLGL|nr:uncharacterized protein GCG54_00013214 [Colletotrichum gloeosporioides]KAF3798473.1 hypothetical protein GCG54_00013214 [Colletotrichum gloeosporioides]